MTRIKRIWVSPTLEELAVSKTLSGPIQQPLEQAIFTFGNGLNNPPTDIDPIGGPS